MESRNLTFLGFMDRDEFEGRKGGGGWDCGKAPSPELNLQ